eukprot:TRINITY_DN6861_c0_g1_i1.p1 TRINITY_DN6861_c0_g1~~TRINITY_DN6861_c0_g1_i1.p1  ORF type:complete len:161 (+),score=12.26 TRINITY_DN6861_c0_g1_i1:117-599(+)
MASPGPALHPALEPIAFLLGRWRGEGEGGYPTISSFKYVEEITLGHSGKPAMAYAQKTWRQESGEPMHAESGFWRPKADGSLEIVIAQSTGLAEVQKGTYDAAAKSVSVRSELVGNASKVQHIVRHFKLEDDGSLSYTVEMATNTQPLQKHLCARLHKMQ